ncbi:MAG: AI-2E family transporter, partial [Micromonosporaceae bacterium]
DVPDGDATESGEVPETAAGGTLATDSGEAPLAASGEAPATDSGEAPEQSERPYGEPGKPLSQSPFLVGLTAGLGLMIAYVAYLGLRDIWSILVLVVVSAFLAIGLNPAVVRLQKLGLTRGLAVTVVALVGLLVSCGGLLAVIPPLIAESVEFLNAVPGYLEDLRKAEWIEQLNERYDVLGSLEEAFTATNVTVALGGVLSGATIVFGQVFNVVTVGILTLYFLAAFDRLKEGAYQFIPGSRRPRARLLGDAILAKVGGYMVGSLLIAGLAGLTSLVFMVITGIPYPLALAVVVAICDLIPQVGATLGAIVLTLVGLTVSIPVAIAAVIFFLLYQQLENWVIYPRVMRRTTQISDLAAILGVLIGAALLGVVGVLIAIPATAAIQLIAREVVFPRQSAH